MTQFFDLSRLLIPCLAFTAIDQSRGRTRANDERKRELWNNDSFVRFHQYICIEINLNTSRYFYIYINIYISTKSRGSVQVLRWSLVQYWVNRSQKSKKNKILADDIPYVEKNVEELVPIWTPHSVTFVAFLPEEMDHEWIRSIRSRSSEMEIF